MSQLYDPDLTQWLQLSGEHIANVRPAGERADWVLFLLSEIKAQLPQNEYIELLEELDTTIRSSQSELDG